MSGVFITGTDTEIGKTFVAQVLMRALQQQGLNVAGMKPVASGAEKVQGQLCNADALALRSAANVEIPYPLLNPYSFAAPIAPHIAAQQQGVDIDIERICTAYAQIAVQADYVVVEGVGGWQVPLGDDVRVRDLSLLLDLPVVLVVGLRLGCINHALLSVESIQGSGARLCGWIANTIDPEYANIPETIEALQQRIDAPCIGQLPFTDNADPMALISCIDLSYLPR